MNKKCCKKHPDHSSELARLNRVIGQLKGISRMIEERRYCIDIVSQLKAAEAATKSLEMNILKRHLESCVKETFTKNSELESFKKIEELISLFKKMN